MRILEGVSSTRLLMTNPLELNFTELTEFVIACRCGSQLTMSTGSAYPPPTQCPVCGQIFDQAAIGQSLYAFRAAFRSLSKIAGESDQPKIILRIRQRD